MNRRSFLALGAAGIAVAALPAGVAGPSVVYGASPATQALEALEGFQREWLVAAYRAYWQAYADSLIYGCGAVHLPEPGKGLPRAWFCPNITPTRWKPMINAHAMAQWLRMTRPSLAQLRSNLLAFTSKAAVRIGCMPKGFRPMRYVLYRRGAGR